MTIRDSGDEKIIFLSKAFDTRAKILHLFYFTLFTFTGLFFKRMWSVDADTSMGFFLFLFLFIGVYLFAAYRFLNKALQTEKLLVNKDTLTISRTGFFSEKKQLYETAAISNLRHLDKPEMAKHPLAGQSFDYLGFQTGQQVINEMHGDNRLAFDYNGKTIKFGENMYSWDFDQLEAWLYDITGKDLRQATEPESIYSGEES